ncbi:MAG: SEC-C metal-binding domain-containing protein [Acidimicrobiales bacterium]
MAKRSETQRGKNRPCPCGSGRRAKRCCGVAPTPAVLDSSMAFLERAARQRSGAITHRCEHCQSKLFMEVLLLPEHYESCRLALPRPLPVAFARLRDAIRAADGDAIADALAPAVELVDTPEVRFSLGQAILALEEQGRCTAEVCAIALDDLAGSSHSALTMAALLSTLTEQAGVQKVPSRMTA